jgi:hypothetical protein
MALVTATIENRDKGSVRNDKYAVDGPNKTTLI